MPHFSFQYNKSMIIDSDDKDNIVQDIVILTISIIATYVNNVDREQYICNMHNLCIMLIYKE